MCGICGIYHFTNNVQVELATARAMCNSLTHRGPDADGYYCNEDIALGIRRLSIIDLATGNQPIWNEDHTYCIVFNGELYNYLDLYPELEAQGHIFRTRSDTEVILHGYEQWGLDCVKHFNGMFAFAIWNSRQKQLYLARDRIGEKPLYYYQATDRLVFASEIKAILQDPCIPRRINPRGLSNFLAFGHSVAPETILTQIYKLPAGHFLLARKEGILIQQYWDVGDEAPSMQNDRLDEKGYAELILDLLDDSVRRRMIADVPLGAFLSGGVDSSTIVALMKRHTSAPVKTFSLGFSIGRSYNELNDARRVANFLGAEHNELNVESVDLVKTLRTLIYHYDEPFGDAANFPLYLLSQFARNYVKVVLAGDGGDELFGGYRRYAADQLARFYQQLPHWFGNNIIPGLVAHLPRLRRIKRTIQTLPILNPARRYADWLLVFSTSKQMNLLQPEMSELLANHDPVLPYEHFYAQSAQTMGNDHLNRLMYLDLKTWLVDCYMEKTDKATMAASLEGRLPFLDHRLVELAFQIPSSMKIKGWSTKRILKRAVQTLVPAYVLNKPKHGFAVPTDPWFRGDLKTFTYDVLLDERTRRRGLIKTDQVECLWREHSSGRNVWDTQLWLLLNLELWSRIYLDGEAI